MRIQEFAYKELQKEGRPLKPEELARRALDQGVVDSRAADRGFSLQSTLRKNVRDGKYNHPKLIVVHLPGQRGMLLALPEWENRLPETNESPLAHTEERKVRMPVDVIKQIELVRQAEMANTFDEALLFLIRKGWAETSPAVQAALNKFFTNGTALGGAR